MCAMLVDESRFLRLLEETGGAFEVEGESYCLDITRRVSVQLRDRMVPLVDRAGGELSAIRLRSDGEREGAGGGEAWGLFRGARRVKMFVL